jgi:ATP-dependent DNA helicase RecG
MSHPEIELLSEHEQSLRHATVYPSTETLTNREFPSHDQQNDAAAVSGNTNFVYRNPTRLSDRIKADSKKNGFVQYSFSQSAEAFMKAKFDWSLRNCSLSIVQLLKTSFRNTK